MPTSNERELEKIMNKNAGRDLLVFVILVVTVAIVILRALISEHRELLDHKNKQIRELQKEVVYLEVELKRYKP